MPSELYSARIRLPVGWKEAIEAEGLEVSDFVRDAMAARFKKLGIKVPKAPEISRGRPPKEKS